MRPPFGLSYVHVRSKRSEYNTHNRGVVTFRSFLLVAVLEGGARVCVIFAVLWGCGSLAWIPLFLTHSGPHSRWCLFPPIPTLSRAASHTNSSLRDLQTPKRMQTPAPPPPLLPPRTKRKVGMRLHKMGDHRHSRISRQNSGKQTRVGWRISPLPQTGLVCLSPLS